MSGRPGKQACRPPSRCPGAYTVKCLCSVFIVPNRGIEFSKIP
ncbi:hypothetical protein RUMHYD_02512 [Blautia hydrogenotrophica DSM 10507]|uniref:Uncharacterized protein n=1 Tax=Blautia hydrogenotrophica (strain DSM 10507 / JCM 14656 / S5a33) TaxID=476272 RepID=C0CNR9_BLAHS|nr:hypothetical protein RUMHYD_02512 [Blautia hydrogenotrophica DSM 10507]